MKHRTVASALTLALSLHDAAASAQRPSRAPASTRRCPVAPRAPAVAPRMVSMSIGAGHTCAAYANGAVRCRGMPSFGGIGRTDPPDPPGAFVDVAGATDVRRVWTFSSGNTLALRRDGTVLAWGSASMGLLGTLSAPDACTTGPCRVTPGLLPGLDRVRDLVTLVVGGACALRDDGTVWCFGSVL
ncbi:MAG: hypothetical protein R3A52_32625 [Polyangiales bacterium]